MYKSWKLKEKLRQHHGVKLIFIECPGKSDQICSSAITVGHAMKEASVLREKLAEDREPMPPQRTETLTDTQIPTQGCIMVPAAVSSQPWGRRRSHVSQPVVAGSHDSESTRGKAGE